MKSRLISLFLFKDGVLFRTKRFVPDYRYTTNFLDFDVADEIAIIDISVKNKQSQSFKSIVAEIISKCALPVAVGGGVDTFEKAQWLFENGVDKLIFGRMFFENINLIKGISLTYGAQSIICSLDYLENESGQRQLIHSTDDVLVGLQRGRDAGVGEFLLNCVSRDGSLRGLDVELCSQIRSFVTHPVLLCGGLGTWDHAFQAFKYGNASGVCVTNIFHLTRPSIINAKVYLAGKKIPIRQ